MAFRDNGERFKNFFLRIDANGILYEYSKEPQEGFDKYVAEKTKTVSYRKYHWQGLEGYLSNIKLSVAKMGDSDVQMFSMAFVDYIAGERYILSLPLNSSSGALNQYVRSFVKYFKNIDYSRKLLFSVMKKQKGEDFAPGMLLFAYANAKPDGGDEYIKSYYKKDTNGWPSLEKVTKMGVEKWDSTKMDEFAYAELVSYIESFESNIREVTKKIKKDLFDDDAAGPEFHNVEAPKSYNTEERGEADAPVKKEAPSTDSYSDDLPF